MTDLAEEVADLERRVTVLEQCLREIALFTAAERAVRDQIEDDFASETEIVLSGSAVDEPGDEEWLTLDAVDVMIAGL